MSSASRYVLNDDFCELGKQLIEHFFKEGKLVEVKGKWGEFPKYKLKIHGKPADLSDLPFFINMPKKEYDTLRWMD